MDIFGNHHSACHTMVANTLLHCTTPCLWLYDELYFLSSIFIIPLLFYAFMLLCGLIPFLSCSLFLFYIFLCNPHYLAFGSCFELLFIILFFSLELNLFNHFPLSSLELCFFFLTQRWPMSFSVFSQLPLLTPLSSRIVISPGRHCLTFAVLSAWLCS